MWAVGGRDIGTLADVVPGGDRHDRDVEIRIWLDQLDPPAGRLRRVGAGTQRVGDAVEVAEARFTGWLGLLRALDRLIGSPAEAEPPGVG